MDIWPIRDRTLFTVEIGLAKSETAFGGIRSASVPKPTNRFFLQTPRPASLPPEHTMWSPQPQGLDQILAVLRNANSPDNRIQLEVQQVSLEYRVELEPWMMTALACPGYRCRCVVSVSHSPPPHTPPPAVNRNSVNSTRFPTTIITSCTFWRKCTPRANQCEPWPVSCSRTIFARLHWRCSVPRPPWTLSSNVVCSPLATRCHWCAGRSESSSQPCS